MIQTAGRQRILYFDILTIFACIAVLFLHHNTIVHSYSDTIVWEEALVFEVAFFWAVPVFLMISGANLMKYREKYTTKLFFKKRLMRVFVPWLFWSVVMLSWSIKAGTYKLEENSILEVFNAILNSKMMPIYWFFPMILGIYLLTPLLSLLGKDEHRSTLWLIINMFIIVNATIPWLCDIIHVQWNGLLGLPFSGYVVHFLLGYLLSEKDITRSKRICIYLFAFFCATIRYAGVYIHSSHLGVRDDIFFNYNYLFSYGLAIGVFIGVKYINWQKPVDYLTKKIDRNVEKAIAKVAGCSLGIYLIQIPLMHYERLLFGMTLEDPIYRMVMPLFTYLVALIIIMLMKKVPGLRYIVP